MDQAEEANATAGERLRRAVRHAALVGGVVGCKGRLRQSVDAGLRPPDLRAADPGGPAYT